MPLDKVVNVVGKSLLIDNSKPAFLDLGSLNKEGVFLQVVGKDVSLGHQPLVNSQVLRDISYKEAFESIVGTEKMQASLEFLYKDYKKGVTMLSYLIATGLRELYRQNKADLPFLDIDHQILEDRLANNGFSKKEMGRMTGIVHNLVPLRERSTVQSWIKGKTKAPLELDYAANAFETSSIEQLINVNPEFANWEHATGRFDSRAFPLDVRAAYWIYRDLVSVVVGYLRTGSIKPEHAQRHNDTGQPPHNEHRRPVQLHYAKEISQIVEYFIGRRTERYISPRVLRTHTTDEEKQAEYVQVTSRRHPNPRLSRGIVYEIPKDFEGKVITVTDLLGEKEVIREALVGIVLDYLTSKKERYKPLYSGLFKHIDIPNSEQVRLNALSLILGKMTTRYDPDNPQNLRYDEIFPGKASKEDRQLLESSLAFSKDITERIRSYKLDNEYSTGKQINAALNIFVKMRDALPYDVHLWIASIGMDRQENLTAKINQTYRINIQNAPEMFAERVRTGIELKEFDSRLGYGVPALNIIDSNSGIQDRLAGLKLKLNSMGQVYFSKNKVSEILASYGVQDLMKFVHRINFPDTLKYTLNSIQFRKY